MGCLHAHYDNNNNNNNNNPSFRCTAKCIYGDAVCVLFFAFCVVELRPTFGERRIRIRWDMEWSEGFDTVNQLGALCSSWSVGRSVGRS